jgi:hypothetical protein
MPTPEQILDGLTKIANEWQWLAVVWHVYFAFLLGGLLLGVRPSKQVAGILLGLPLLSVSALAWATANPFNGALFAIVGIGLIAVPFKLPPERVQMASPWITAVGLLLFLFGWVYPHFLETTSFVPYLFAAPTGLIPCPTLSIVIGLSLMVEGLNSRLWSLMLGAAGVFYGLFGALRLGVTIDLVLLFGALLLVLVAYLPKHGVRQQALAH